MSGGLWCLTFNSFIGGGNRSTRRKLLTCRKFALPSTIDHISILTSIIGIIENSYCSTFVRFIDFRKAYHVWLCQQRSFELFYAAYFCLLNGKVCVQRLYNCFWPVSYLLFAIHNFVHRFLRDRKSYVCMTFETC